MVTGRVSLAGSQTRPSRAQGNPDRPMCGFSNMACRILDAHDVPYGSRDVLSDPDLREGIKQFTHWPTIPQASWAE